MDEITKENVSLLKQGLAMLELNVEPLHLIQVLLMQKAVLEKGDEVSLRDAARIHVESIEILESFSEETKD